MAPIFEELPFAYVIWESTANSYCHFCCVKKVDLSRCSRCKFAHYCGKTCQMAAWKDHAQECKGLQKMHPVVPHKYTRLMARIFVKLADDPKQLGYREDGGNRTFGELMSHVNEISDDGGRYLLFLKAEKELRDFIDQKYISIYDPLEVFGKVVINTFSMRDGSNGVTDFGSGLYLGVSELDHSCDPSADFVFSGRKIILNRIKNLEAQKELDLRKVTISYIDTLPVTADRQKQLQEAYYFRCSCALCLDRHHDQLKQALLCKHPHCGGPVLISEQGTGKCDACGREALDVEDGIEMLEYAKSVISDTAAADTFTYSYLKDLSDKLGGYLHPLNIYYNRVLQIGIAAIIEERPSEPDACSMERKQWFQKIHNVFIEGYRKAYARRIPELAVFLILMADVMLAFDDLDGAVSYLRQASDEAKITHGENHEIFEKIRKYFDVIVSQRLISILDLDE